ncbi:MAG: hypothetical protein L0G22_04055 [Propionibacteriaceae bacterium]|nr:hypothetical protein [Propionibacteriaceae bacterium]
MRTTVTLDPDTEAVVHRLMTRKGITFKQALNDAIRAGAAETALPAFETTVHRMGVPAVSLDRALQLAGEIEDEEIIRAMRVGR